MTKWLGGLAILLLFGWGVAQARPERTHLPNGLQLITERVPQMPLVAIEVWVRAGTAYETPETSGVAHLLEHLLFKGTPDHPKGALDLAFERAGGLLEASTERDWVRFRATVLKDRWREPLSILLAHLFNPLLPETELERERTIILEDEYPLHRLSPVRVARYALFAQRFPNHPYGLPLLGDPERLRTLPNEAVRTFHRQHYPPDRFVVVLVGDLSHEEALQVVKASSPDRRSSASPASRVSVEMPTPIVWVEQNRPAELLAVSLPAPPAQQVDALLMTELLRVAIAEPYLGLLYARFSETESHLPFGRLQSEFLPRIQPGLVAFYFLPPVPAMEDWQAQVRQRWQTALARLQTGQARAWIEQAKRIAILRHQQQMANPLERARLYGLYATLGVPSLPEEWVQRLQAIAPEQVEAYLSALLEGKPLPESEPARLSALPPPAERAMPQIGSPVRLRLANGVRIIHLPLQEAQSLHLQLVFHTPPDQRAPRGVAELTARLLFTATQNETEATLGYRMARSGGTLQVFWEPNAIRVAVVARPNALQNMLSLLAEGLTRPEFTPESLRRAKAMAQAERRWAEGAREWNAYALLTDYATDESLEPITLADVRRFYHACFRPEHLVIVSAGDLRPEQVAHEVNQFLGTGWQVDPVRAPTTEAGRSIRTTRLHRTADGLSYWVYGLSVEARLPEQVVGAWLYQTVLSGGKGARLFTHIREGQGWGYDFGGLNLLEPGRVALLGFLQAGRAYAGQPDDLSQLLSEAVRPEELERAKAFLLGTWHRDRMELSEYLRRLAEAELSGVGIALETELPKWIESVSLEAVQAFGTQFQPDQPYLPTNGTNTHSP